MYYNDWCERIQTGFKAEWDKLFPERRQWRWCISANRRSEDKKRGFLLLMVWYQNKNREISLQSCCGLMLVPLHRSVNVLRSKSRSKPNRKKAAFCLAFPLPGQFLFYVMASPNETVWSTLCESKTNKSVKLFCILSSFWRKMKQNKQNFHKIFLLDLILVFFSFYVVFWWKKYLFCDFCLLHVH